MTEAILVLQALTAISLVTLLIAARKATATHTALLIRLVEKAKEPVIIRVVQPVAAKEPPMPQPPPTVPYQPPPPPVVEKQVEPPPVIVPQTPASPVIVTQQAVIPPDPNIHEIVKRRDEHHPWEHHGWCRAHTPAWQTVWDTPHEALKIGGEIVEGVQDAEL